MKLRNALLGACAAAVVGAGVAEAQNLRYAIGWPPGSSTATAIDTMGQVTAAETDGALTVRLFPLSLLNFLEASEGVRDGLADMVTILPPYFLSVYPATNFASELSGLVDLEGLEGDLDARAGIIFGSAFAEYVLLNCPACIAEFAAANSVPLAGTSSPGYILQCNKPVTTFEELQGKRIRAGGAWWARWAEGNGATPVSMSVNETFEALSQGVIDCTANAATELTNFSFIDVATDITLGAPGAGFPAVISTINKDTWGRLDADKRTAILKGAARVAGEVMWVYYTEAVANIERSRERGINVHVASDDLRERSQAYIAADVATIVASYNDRFGLGVGDAEVEKMRGLIQKWAGMVGDADSADDLTAMVWDEILSKVDPESFGM